MRKDAASCVREQLEAFNAREFERFAASVSEDIRYQEFGSGLMVEGRAAFVAATTARLSAWSDVQGTILSIVDGGDQAAAEVRWVGTHDGPVPSPAGELPPTGATIELNTVVVVRAAGGVITTVNYYFNMLRVLEQIGGLSSPPDA
ncbi:SnoaL-like domain protein [Enhygromyxa salina]|uniref:SnoaL-like domain protein n=1 Tax=Enhygromyxa salina TaxID=215803 RepID=A0A2S9Y4U4_9BACT|nr:nuclear transport factor 2 family protein [Enhygromyxa salina]PRQ00031.1 SnoaL-like domain protein [Enhygromyxa salina]